MVRGEDGDNDDRSLDDNPQVSKMPESQQPESQPMWAEWLLGAAGRGLTPFVPGFVWQSYPGNWVKDLGVDYHGNPEERKGEPDAKKGESLEEQLRRSAPADLASLAAQLAEERDAFVARTVLAAKLPGWEGCSLSGTKVAPLKAGICRVSNRGAAANADVVLKLLGEDSESSARIAAAHRALGDAGVATALLASGPDWTIEALGTGRAGAYEPANKKNMCAQNAGLAARLHAAPTAWWPPHKDALRALLPALLQEPDSSPLYTLAAFAAQKGNRAAPVFADPRERRDLASLMAALPRPEGEAANRVVNVHGDLWDGNILAGGGGALVVTDLESAAVCGAVQDLAFTPEPEMIEAYLRGVAGRDPSAEEVAALLFEARLANHIHFEVLRGVFMINGNRGSTPPAEPAGVFVEHARELAAVADAVRGSAKLRRRVLDIKAQAWCYWDAEALAREVEASR